MANIIKPKRSNTAAKVPTTTELISGELGVNMADRKVYINNGTAVVQVGSGNLSGLGDVAIATPANGQALTYNSTTSKWENSSAGTGSVTSVGITPGTGVTVSGSPVTTSGNIAVGLSTKLTAIENLSGAGFFTQNGSGAIAGRTLQAGTGISIQHGNGSSQDPIITNSAPDQTVALTGAGATTITGTYPNFTITSVNTTYSTATSTVPGLIELASDTAQTVAANAVTATASRSYGLQLNAAGQGVVNVPWTDTVYSLPAATSTVRGGIELGSDTAQTVAANAVSATASRSYALQVNADGQGVVNVPWTDTNSGGTVTSVGGTGTVSGLTLTGTVTTSGNLTLGGTLAVTPSNFASQTANTFLAAPNGAAGVPTFRAMVAADVPTLNQNTTGSAATLTTGRTIAMTGDVSYTSGSFNGSANVTGTATLANSGVTAGTYTKVTVNAKGLTTSGTTLAASDIPDLTMAKLPGAAYKESVICATTANITLSGTQTIDGIAVVAGNRVLVKNQTTASQNGIYVVAAGAWTRSLDADNSSEIGAAVVNVDSGAANGGELWTTTFKTTDTLGTTAMNWYEVLYNSGSWGISITGSSASTTGNAATATTLQTARTINGVSFNGSANITVADATKLPLAGGTMTGAIAFAAGQTWPTFNQNTTGTAANVTGTVALANGGTGATTAAAARTNLGATTLGGNLYTLANVAAIAFPRFNADNTVSSLDAASFRTAIGAGTSSTTGTVTSVAVSGGTTGLTTSGGPITSSGTITLAGTLAVANGGTGATTAAAARTNLGAGTVSSVGGTGTVSGLSLSGTVTTSGNLTLGGTLSVTPSNFASQTANTVLAAPSGTAGVPTFRTLVDADIPALTLAKLPGAAYKQSVRCATTANLTATATTTTLTNSSTLAALVLDGITVATNDRVLVKNQTTAAQNGIYTVTNVGSASVAWVLTRTADADNADEIGAAVVNVDSGTTNGGELWTTTFKTTDTLGTTAMNWYEVLYNTGTWGISISGSAATLTTARTIQTNLASTSSASFNGSANITPGVTGTLPIANGGTGATTAAAARTALGAGTVTSVGGTGTVSGLTLTGTVTSSGNLTLGGNLTIAADMIYNSFTATAAQTTFTTTNTYTSGKIDVFVNGVKMVNGSDVTVTSGTSVVMAAGLPVGTRVDLVYPI